MSAITRRLHRQRRHRRHRRPGRQRRRRQRSAAWSAPTAPRTAAASPTPTTRSASSTTSAISQGNHTIKFGGEVRPIRLYTDRLGGTTYTFSNVNDLLANRPSQVQFLGDVSMPSPWNNGATGNRLAKQNYYIGYAQDEWRIRPNFTLNYGIALRVLLRAAAKTAMPWSCSIPSTAASSPTPPPSTRARKTNFAPAPGLCWSPTRFNGKTVFRIGGGYYFGPGQTEDQVQPIESDRVSRTLRNVQLPDRPC